MSRYTPTKYQYDDTFTGAPIAPSFPSTMTLADSCSSSSHTIQHAQPKFCFSLRSCTRSSCRRFHGCHQFRLPPCCVSSVGQNTSTPTNSLPRSHSICFAPLVRTHLFRIQCICTSSLPATLVAQIVRIKPHSFIQWFLPSQRSHRSRLPQCSSSPALL